MADPRRINTALGIPVVTATDEARQRWLRTVPADRECGCGHRREQHCLMCGSCNGTASELGLYDDSIDGEDLCLCSMFGEP